MPDVYKCLAHPVRREILKLLRERDRSAGELAGRFDLAKPTMSGHFAMLRDAGLVHADKKGTTIVYRLNVSVLEEALAALMDVMRIGGATAPNKAGRKEKKGEG